MTADNTVAACGVVPERRGFAALRQAGMSDKTCSYDFSGGSRDGAPRLPSAWRPPSVDPRSGLHQRSHRDRRLPGDRATRAPGFQADPARAHGARRLYPHIAQTIALLDRYYAAIGLGVAPATGSSPPAGAAPSSAKPDPAPVSLASAPDLPLPPLVILRPFREVSLLCHFGARQPDDTDLRQLTG